MDWLDQSYQPINAMGLSSGPESTGIWTFPRSAGESCLCACYVFCYDGKDKCVVYMYGSISNILALAHININVMLNIDPLHPLSKLTAKSMNFGLVYNFLYRIFSKLIDEIVIPLLTPLQVNFVKLRKGENFFETLPNYKYV